MATDGDKGYQPFADTARNRRVRRREQDAAAAMWHAREVVYLGYPDGRFGVAPDLVARVAGELLRLAPEYVLTFDPDYPPRVTHRDHRCIGTAVRRALDPVTRGEWLLYFSTRAPNFAVDVTDLWEWRWQLLHLHRSQFTGPRRRLAHRLITRDALTGGKLIGARYGEALRCVPPPGGKESG